LFETIANLKRVGIAFAGASREQDTMNRPTVLQVQGWSVALFAVTEIWNQGPIDKHAGRHHVAWADYERLEEPLRKARRRHDIVLLTYHGGSEYVDVPMMWTRKFAKQVVQAGVDGFIGHHPHVPHGVEWIGGTPVFPSVGNLIFSTNEHRWTATGYLVRFSFRRTPKDERNGKGVPGPARALLLVEICPYDIIGQVPRPFEGKRRKVSNAIFRRHISDLSTNLGGTFLGEPNERGCLPLRAPTSKKHQ
jgi:poly-gamma-glutamate synthesis protein (capsule biosynthesis protein)